MDVDSLPNGVDSDSQPAESWLVQKFGGTSVGKFPLDIIDNVIK